MNHKTTLSAALCCAAGVFFAASAQATTVNIINNNAAGVGFNDPTAAVPVGGNAGTTIGAQRLIAFQFAADIWASKLRSAVPISVRAEFKSLSCTATSGTLGSAGGTSGHINFTGAPLANTIYIQALANSLAGIDINTSQPDITASFNSDLGTATCLTSVTWYYGLDGKPPAGKIDFVTTLLHELGHGLGMSAFYDKATGAKNGGFDDIYMTRLEQNGAIPSALPSMDDAQRAAASISGNLLWNGPNAQANSGILTAGKIGTKPRVYAPSTLAGGSSVSHWDTTATPNLLMEPFDTGDAIFVPQLELHAFRDMSWKMNSIRRDFTNDLTSDIIWRDAAGNTVISAINGAAIVSSTLFTTLGSPWTLAGSGDFNGDGKADLLWQDTAGNTVVSLTNGTGNGIASSTLIATLGSPWIIAGIGDFNNDGTRDILWRNTSNGAVSVSFMSNGVISATHSLGSVPTNFLITALGDFNGDGKTDILWRDNANGNTIITIMGLAAGAPTFVSSTFVANLPLTWSIAGVGDFNGDGFADILWRDTTTGNMTVSLVRGSAIISSTGIGTAGGYVPVAVGDYNADGKWDVLLRETSTGNTVVGLMSGTTTPAITGVFIGNVPTAWSVPPGHSN